MNLLHTIRLEDIDEVKLSNQNMEIETTVDISIGDHGETASYVDITEHDSLPAYVLKAATDFTSSVYRMLRERTHNHEALPCLTCTSACCYHEGVVRVTISDLERLKLLGKPIDSLVDFYPEYKGWEGTDWAGYVGQMVERVVPSELDPQAHSDGETGCAMIGLNGCSIYEHRPDVCRSYSPWTCGDTYNADPKKIKARADGKYTLKVLPPGA